MLKIISISGLDGSGKSTQTELLKNHLESQGKKVFYFHAIKFSIANILNKKTGGQGVSASNKSVIKANWLQIKLRKLAFMIDIFRFKLLRSKLTRQGYDYILSDRYFHDTIINLIYLMNKNNLPDIEKNIPPADKSFYLKTNPESIMQRAHAPEQGLEYLKKKDWLYEMYASLWDLKTIDGNRNKEEIANEIKSQIIIINAD